jgi:hypothetical protein
MRPSPLRRRTRRHLDSRLTELGRATAAGGRRPRTAAGGSASGVELHRDGNWYGRYTKLQAAVTDAGLSAKSKRYDFEAHHLLEESMAAGFKIKESEGWCVGVEHMDHVEFTRDMRGLLSKKKRAVWDIDELYELHAQMYEDKGHPEYARAVAAVHREQARPLHQALREGRRADQALPRRGHAQARAQVAQQAAQGRAAARRPGESPLLDSNRRPLPQQR